MVMVKEEDINAIRKACNIVDIISSSIPVTLKVKYYKCVCPFHDDHSPSMSISTSKQIYKCFSFYLYQKYINIFNLLPL